MKVTIPAKKILQAREEEGSQTVEFFFCSLCELSRSFSTEKEAKNFAEVHKVYHASKSTLR